MAKKKSRKRRVFLIVLLTVSGLTLLTAAFFLLVPLTEHGDETPVEGSADWMSRLDDDLKLNRVTLPGTHDSATNYVQLSWFSKCQSLGIGEQLEAGARYLDIRLSADGDGLILTHGFTKCKSSAFGGALSLEEVLNECYAFLDAHPTETVVFAVKREQRDVSIGDMQLMIDKLVKESPSHWLLTDRIPSVGQARGKLVLVRRYNDEAGLGTDSGISFLWADQPGHNDTSLNTVSNGNGSFDLWVQDRFEYGTDDKWNAFMTGITDNGAKDKDIALHFLSTKGTAKFGHPYGFAKKLNQKLLDTPSDKLSGWIVTDFFTPSIASHIYESNFSE